MRLLKRLVPLAAVLSSAAWGQAVSDDPYIWLEEKDSPRAMAWVEAHNAKAVATLEADRRYQPFYDEALKIATAEDRIPMPAFRNGGIFNFWQDGEHLRGLWRRTTLADYRSKEPKWRTVLDVDALGKAEGKSWVWKGANCLMPEERLCMISLSDGGEDATQAREFDLAKNAFVKDGFFLPRSQLSFDWEDADHLLVSTDWSGQDLTESGYPYIVKRVSRGQPLAAAHELFRGYKSDVGVFPSVLRDGNGNTLSLLVRAKDFFHSETFVLTGNTADKLAIPEKASVSALVAGRAIVSLDENWSVAGTTFKAGSVVALNLAELKKDPGKLVPTLVWAPGPRDALDGISTTKDRLLLSTLHNVSGRVLSFAPLADGNWGATQIALPDNLALGVAAADDKSNAMFLTAQGFLTPSTLYIADAAAPAAPEALKHLPAKFDASNDVVEQFEATSSDGTKIPYFVVHRTDMKLDGSTPTLMTAYGGFQSSETPYYSGAIGKLWLERGGAYVLANIRGGGEFGPAWHEAGLGAKRQIIYDDFAAVAKDLEARKITSPRRLGIYGGSNGGLLMGVAMVQYPELFNAITIQVPLLDMIRISKIARGASWQGEYGDVNADPAIRAFWEKTSPYQNLKRGGKYPEPYIFTTTKDDRTGPQHARKFAARMEEYGLPFLYYENTEGGHGSGADAKQSAVMTAQMMVYFSRKLMD
uniref:prolyl oligopeptidase family serine peptidase n=1 Tax=Altererythrobacter segetis TaxID=1104773 RepID=UPI00140E7CF9|nr:prolyl oligopeptidase family serine peptidase [Altererythrobacter segetis]